MTFRYSDFGLHVSDDNSGNLEFVDCPHCQADHPGSPSVLVYRHQEQWICHHCGWRGDLRVGDNKKQSWLFKQPHIPILSSSPLQEKQFNWFATYGVSRETVERYNIQTGWGWNPSIKAFNPSLAIPFVRDGLVVNVKHLFGRRTQPNFTIASEIIPFGLEDLSSDCTIICGDETDKLVLASLGINAAISLPFAPSSLPKPKKTKNNLSAIHENLAFLETHEARFKPVQKFILALGSDPAAQELEEELGRRLGRERCWTVKWPEDSKSFSEVFKKAPDIIPIMIGQAKPYPVKGVFDFEDIKSTFDDLYEKGLPAGARTGWNGMDEYYRPALGQWTLVTGIPSHGKSNFLDALFCNLALNQDWKFCIFSPENQPIARHFANLAEKYTGKSFNHKAKPEDRMTLEQKQSSETWLQHHFSVILPDEESGNWSIDGILELARSVILRKGIQGMIIDPWNEIDHSRLNGLSETEHISRTISQIRQFARAHSVHIWVVAHPTKMPKGDDGFYLVPTPYDVAGCHDEFTEVLTQKGWYLHKDITPGDLVACFDPIDGSLRYEPPQQLHSYPYQGQMHHYSGRGLDLMVTPNHRMLVKPNWNTPRHHPLGAPTKWSHHTWNFATSESLTGAHYVLPTNTTKAYERGTTTLEESVLRQLAHQVILSKEDEYATLPVELHALVAPQRALFMSLLFHRAQFETRSSSLADQLQQLGVEQALKIDVKHVGTRFILHIASPSTSERTLLIRKNRTTVDYTGHVYCLTVSTGAYITRRNGVMGLSGNSAHFLNKADFALSIYRFVGSQDQTITDVYIQKVRFKENGTVGRYSLRYIPSSGRFIDDIDQAKRTMALNKRDRQPTEYFLAKGKMPTPEFHDDVNPTL